MSHDGRIRSLERNAPYDREAQRQLDRELRRLRSVPALALRTSRGRLHVLGRWHVVAAGRHPTVLRAASRKSQSRTHLSEDHPYGGSPYRYRGCTGIMARPGSTIELVDLLCLPESACRYCRDTHLKLARRFGATDALWVQQNALWRSGWGDLTALAAPYPDYPGTKPWAHLRFGSDPSTCVACGELGLGTVRRRLGSSGVGVVVDPSLRLRCPVRSRRVGG